MFIEVREMVLAAEITRKVEVPEGVTVSISGSEVVVKGPKGELKRDFGGEGISLSKSGGGIIISSKFPKRKDKAMVGTIAGHIANMIKGVTEGFEYHMVVYDSHFPMNVSVQGKDVVIKNFLGEKYPRKSKIVGDTKVDVKGQDITISGISLEDVGQTAANLRLASRIGRKDPRVFQDGIFLADKEAKK